MGSDTAGTVAKQRPTDAISFLILFIVATVVGGRKRPFGPRFLSVTLISKHRIFSLELIQSYSFPVFPPLQSSSEGRVNWVIFLFFQKYQFVEIWLISWLEVNKNCITDSEKMRTACQVGLSVVHAFRFNKQETRGLLSSTEWCAVLFLGVLCQHNTRVSVKRSALKNK